MRKLILGAFLLVCVCALPQKHDFNVVFDKIEYKNVPEQFKQHHTIREKKLVDNGRPNRRSQRDLEATVNDYADQIFKNIRVFMVQSDLDPLAVPDMHSGFSYTLIITYHGELDLTNGELKNLDSVKRDGDVIADYSTDDKYLIVTTPIAFDTLSFTYDYHASIMGLGPSGGIEGKVAGITVEVIIGFDVETLEFDLVEFSITDSGHISFHFTGNSLIDWLLNLLTEVVTTLLKKVILSVLEDVIGGGLEGIIDYINEAVGGLFNPTTPAPAIESAQFFNALMDLRK